MAWVGAEWVCRPRFSAVDFKLGVTMRTALFLVAGLSLLGAALLLGKLFSTHYPSATFVATVAYVALWLVITGVNMWVGVAKAGYSVTGELPIFLLIFSVPAAVSILLKWKAF